MSVFTDVENATTLSQTPGQFIRLTTSTTEKKTMPRARLKQRSICHYCKVRPGTTTDHVVPRAFGGPDARWNYVSSCPTCNLAKAASWPDENHCDFCRAAVARFLTDEVKREKALVRISSQISELDDGIFSMQNRIERLSTFRRRLLSLHENIAARLPEVTDE